MNIYVYVYMYMYTYTYLLFAKPNLIDNIDSTYFVTLSVSQVPFCDWRSSHRLPVYPVISVCFNP